MQCLDHTIFLRTRNRSSSLKNYLQLLSAMEYRGTVLIVDDSDELQYQYTLNFLGELRQKDVPYQTFLHRGPKFSSPYRWERVLESTHFGLKKIDTEFFSLSSDDDFIFPKFIFEGLSFLKNNLEYAAFTGPEWKLSRNRERIIVSIKTWNSCEYDDPLDRLIDYLYRPSLAYYGVVRSSILSLLTLKVGSRNLFMRSQKAIRFWDEEIPWVALVHIAGKIFYQEKIFQGVRGNFELPDRIENMAKNNPFNNPYSTGALGDLLESDSSIFLKETIQDLNSLIEKVKSQYNNETIEFCIKSFVWNSLTRYKGVPLKKILLEVNETIDKGLSFKFKFITKLKRFVRKRINSADLNSYLNLIKLTNNIKN